MKRKIVSGIMLTLLLASMLTLTIKIQPAEGSGTIWIWDNGQVTPPSAPISTVDNITYTFTSDINESIKVYAFDIVIDGAGYALRGPGGSPDGVGIHITEYAWNVTIKNMRIYGFPTGIKLTNTTGNSISGNILVDNGNGTWFHGDSYSNNVSDNLFLNEHTSIWTEKPPAGWWGSNLNIISGNTFSGYGDDEWPQISYCSFHDMVGNNSIYHNNFIDVDQPVKMYPGKIDIWDDGYPSGGNYWSEYIYDFPDAQELDGSRIWDTPYPIDENQNDTYPLIREDPVADSIEPYNGVEGFPVTFDGSGSFDPDGVIVSYEWDFGDGSYGTGVSPTHTYAQEGTYDVILIVTDDDGIKGLDFALADISDTDPTADFSGTPTGMPGCVSFTDLSTSYDGVTGWEWDFDSDSVVDSTVQNPTHVYEVPGVYTVTLTVYEDDGSSDTETKVDYITMSVDVAVMDIMLYNPAVYKGQFTPINVTVENQGDFTETFNVTAYYGWYVGFIGKQTVYNLPPGGSTTLTFIWNTTGVPYNNWDIIVNATILPGETEAWDNAYITGNVLVTFPGDIWGDPTDPDPSVPDGDVDRYDYGILAQNYGKKVV